eukprot:517820_1
MTKCHENNQQYSTSYNQHKLYPSKAATLSNNVLFRFLQRMHHSDYYPLANSNLGSDANNKHRSRDIYVFTQGSKSLGSLHFSCSLLCQFMYIWSTRCNINTSFYLNMEIYSI